MVLPRLPFYMLEAVPEAYSWSGLRWLSNVPMDGVALYSILKPETKSDSPSAKSIRVHEFLLKLINIKHILFKTIL